MSIPVELTDLTAAMARYGPAAFLLTGGDDGRPHVSHVLVDREGSRLVVPSGGRTARNASARPLVALLWPPVEPGGFSLIVDAEAASADDGRLGLVPTRAVLHRPAGTATGEAVDFTDCRPLEL
ncbi:MAG TPA: pyridoxamine 5'-phosphate oxidase family protein [Acidimicrobiales bacterium]|jgi:hypothetical protein|nr:pyridoxamine 5'-phosphate oxidase family protein [Acidimicrobiales bacterium]